MKENADIAILLKKYREGTCTPEERDELFAFMKDHDIRRLLIEDMEKTFVGSGESTRSLTEEASDRIARSLMEQIGQEEIRQLPHKKKYNLAWIAAAILLSAISIFFILRPTVKPERNIQVGQKEIKKIVLPDGSLLWVNSASTVRYRQTFGKERREVYLDEGEAYFDVKQNPKVPFIVHSGSIHITVLGTSFRIKSYKMLSEIKVSVLNGKVSVSEGKKEIALLHKNEEVVYHKNNRDHEIRNVKETLARALEWREGKIVLEAVSFDDIMLAIANRYAVKPVYDHALFSACESSIVIGKNSTLQETMEQLALIQNIEFNIIGTEVRITGTGCK